MGLELMDNDETPKPAQAQQTNQPAATGAAAPERTAAPRGTALPKGLDPRLALSALLKRPLLVGGLGLSATLALVGNVHFNPLDGSTLLSAIAMGSGVWWWRRNDRAPVAPKPIAPPVVDRPRVEAELAALATLIATLAQETELVSGSALSLETLRAGLTTYRHEHQALGRELERQTLRVAIAGDPRTGKTTLLTLLAAEAEQTPSSGLLTFEEVALTPTATPDWLSYDGLLLITDGDLTNSAYTLLRDRVIAGQGTVLVFNKHDHYDTADQQTILAQLQQRVATLPAAVPVVSAAAAPRTIKVRRHQADGTVTETMETPEPAIAGLQSAVAEALVAERATLVAATVLRRTQALRQRVQTDLNRLRRDRA
ncbi:MAG TPA: hypothetical protein VEZ50_05215, partial [Nodosilinea sp.]|nr:hypothetical protein [Nodosilinea sp.]